MRIQVDVNRCDARMRSSADARIFMCWGCPKGVSGEGAHAPLFVRSVATAATMAVNNLHC